MNPQEHQLTYPLDTRQPEPGHSLAVAPGVHWIKMPLPFALDHINLWLLRDQINGQDGWTLIDCGVTRDDIKALWEQVFDHVLQGLPVLRVIVTHMHPDHVGLAHWLCERWQAPLWMSMSDYITARHWSSTDQGSANGGQASVDHFARHGLRDPAMLEGIRARSSYYVGLVPSVPEQFVRILDGDALMIGGQTWQAIAGYGHAPEHIALFCAGHSVLISGDMVLPRISTNVSVHAYEPLGNPLKLYLDSLHRYSHLPADTLVLPSHGRPFRGLHERIAQQHAHHRERLDELLKACITPRSAFDILPVLFKRALDTHQTTFAMGEAIAHLNWLYLSGKMRRTRSADDTYLFQTI